MNITGWCVKCKEKDVTIENVNIHRTKNGRYMAKGKHTCGTTICSIMSKEKALAAISSGIKEIVD